MIIMKCHKRERVRCSPLGSPSYEWIGVNFSHFVSIVACESHRPLRCVALHTKAKDRINRPQRKNGNKLLSKTEHSTRARW